MLIWTGWRYHSWPALWPWLLSILSTSPFIRANSLIFKALQGPPYVVVKSTITDLWGFIRYLICCLLPTDESLLGIGLRYHLQRFCRKILTIIPSTYSLRLPDFVRYRFCMRLLLMDPLCLKVCIGIICGLTMVYYISNVISTCVMTMLMIDAMSWDTCIHIQMSLRWYWSIPYSSMLSCGFLPCMMHATCFPSMIDISTSCLYHSMCHKYMIHAHSCMLMPCTYLPCSNVKHKLTCIYEDMPCIYM